jgi:hypothetical protein
MDTQDERRRWTADSAAEDLVGQVRELIAESAPASAVVRALENEGLELDTARAVVTELAPDARLEASDLACGVDAQGLRARLELDTAEVLAHALAQHGLQTATAATLVAELRASERRLNEQRRARLRRLGLHGMVVGSVFTALFVWTATRGDHDGRVDIVTAGLTALLALYSLALYRKHGPDHP